MAVVYAFLRQSGRSRRLAAALAACAVVATVAPVARAVDVVENTAAVSYRDSGTGDARSIVSNTVRTPIRQPGDPTPELEFRRYDPGGTQGSSLPIDGGMCRVGEAVVPLPPVSDLTGDQIDLGDVDAGLARGFYVGEPVLVVVTDASANLDPSERELVQVRITTDTADAEVLWLQETGPDTGVFSAAIQSRTIPPAAVQNDCELSLVDKAEIIARYGELDAPMDVLVRVAVSHEPPPLGQTSITLSQTVSRQYAEVGDFLQYSLTVSNAHAAPAFDVRIVDRLPAGVDYRPGSLRIRGAGGTEPVLSAGGTMRLPVGDLAPGGSATLTFVAEVGGQARGPELVNPAVARAAGALSSNDTETVVLMREAFAVERFTIVGRVTLGSCDAGADPVGVAGVRLLMEDGTFVRTDEQGAYHFEGVRPGTHVVQLDVPTLPPGTEPARCRQDTRFAGVAHSRFVEGQGGSLVRADFTLARAAPEESETRVRLLAQDERTLVIDADGGKAALERLRLVAMLPTGSAYVPGSATSNGASIPDPQVSGNALVFDLGDLSGTWQQRIQVHVDRNGCDAPGQASVMAVFRHGDTPVKTTPTTLTWPCGPPQAEVASDRSSATVAIVPEGSVALPFEEQRAARAAIVSDVEASGGGDVDWFAGKSPGHAWLFPAEGHNPRAPSTRVVILHRPGETVSLRVNGTVASPLNFDGTAANAARTMATSTWGGLDLVDGPNRLDAEILDSAGTVVATLQRDVHYANGVAQAALVPEQSILVADGIHRPVIAVRMLDRYGRPARHGVSGRFSISAPYRPAFDAGAEHGRQVMGLEAAGQTWRVEGDEGIAYIELEPTGTAGSFTLGFDFGGDARHRRIEGWLKSSPRDWVVVGFAKGSVGYATLEDNMQPLEAGEVGSGVRGDGQVSLYAKGRVLGTWMLTLAYDTDKARDRLERTGLLSTIDPQQYYTLYGDGTQQGYDASSTSKLYLKLERDQFYALFGDFQTGLDRGELSRYQRTLNGLKVEYHGPLVEINAFAAQTTQNYARDEIPGDGTSGLYRLAHRGVLINSERVRIETRDRYHSERLVAARELVRHIDYDIDYADGTLFFREPIASRDFDFNPNIIVVEYETRGGAGEYLNAGGRAGVRLLDGRLEAGATYIHDEDMADRNELVGIDARYRPTVKDEIRAEVASTRGQVEDADVSGNAWLVEWEHRGEQANLLAYARRHGIGFGLGQQSWAQQGTFKAGVQGQRRIDDRFSLQGEVFRLENLANGATRNAAHADIAYRGDGWASRVGLQWAHDEAADGRVAESQQVTLGANRGFLDNRLELGFEAATSLGGHNESVDYPTRLQLNAAYAVTPAFRLVAAQEYTDGEHRDTSTTRFGFEATPWKDAKLTSTFNQSEISEYGPRTFALFGLNQGFVLGEHWRFDVSVDASHAFNASGELPLVVDPSQPIAPGGIRDGSALTEEFVALSGGVAYRTDLWAWNARLEGRQGDSDRYGLTTGFLRQIRDGVALSASAQAFTQRNADGSTGLLANALLGWAWRPTDSRWSMLDKLELRVDEATRPGDAAAGGGSLRSRRLVNNFVLNHASDAWDDGDSSGVFDIRQRSELSLFYGSKYVMDTYDDEDFSGYTDLLGVEWRHDLSERMDIGLRASVRHSWSNDTYAWAFGPSFGFSPFTNAWLSIGYNLKGFEDRDFDRTHNTAEGAYLVFRIKFDQETFGLGADARGAAR